jgi:hypothetical protein
VNMLASRIGAKMSAGSAGKPVGAVDGKMDQLTAPSSPSAQSYGVTFGLIGKNGGLERGIGRGNCFLNWSRGEPEHVAGEPGRHFFQPVGPQFPGQLRLRPSPHPTGQFDQLEGPQHGSSSSTTATPVIRVRPAQLRLCRGLHDLRRGRAQQPVRSRGALPEVGQHWEPGFRLWPDPNGLEEEQQQLLQTWVSFLRI